MFFSLSNQISTPKLLTLYTLLIPPSPQLVVYLYTPVFPVFPCSVLFPIYSAFWMKMWQYSPLYFLVLWWKVYCEIKAEMFQFHWFSRLNLNQKVTMCTILWSLRIILSIKAFSGNDLNFFVHFKLVTNEKFADFLFLMADKSK